MTCILMPIPVLMYCVLQYCITVALVHKIVNALHIIYIDRLMDDCV